MDEASRLLRFLDACRQLPELSILSDEELAWYWDYNYRPADILSILVI